MPLGKSRNETVVDLESTAASYFTSKMALFGNIRRIAIPNKPAIEKAIAKFGAQRRGTEGRAGRSYDKKSPGVKWELEE